LDFEIDPGGRPALAERRPQFNVSHTGGVALIAVSQSAPIGVDVERLRRMSMSEDRRRRIIAAAASFTKAVFDPDRDVDVLRAWVCLEAVAKARGSGIGVLLTEQAVIGSRVRKQSAGTQLDLAVAELDVGAGYVAAVAADQLPGQIPITTFPTGAAELAEFLSEQGL
jgi:4'-phosphopantetheinyl transferase